MQGLWHAVRFERLWGILNLVRPSRRCWSRIQAFHGVRQQVVVGRVAQLGFAAAVIGEKVTGKGPLTQFGLEVSPLTSNCAQVLVSLASGLLSRFA